LRSDSNFRAKLPQYKIDTWLLILEDLKDHVVFSGGFAWHFMSPEGHAEYKHAHDHKDVDLMVPPANVGTVMSILGNLGFEKVRTKYDRLPSEEDFRRYEMVWEDGENPPFRLTIDFFVKDVRTLQCEGGWVVVHPEDLLAMYSNIHSSDNCWAVQAAARLLKIGEVPEDLIGRHVLMMSPDLEVYSCTKCSWMGQFPRKEGKHLVCGGEGDAYCGSYTVRNVGKPVYKIWSEVMMGAEAIMGRIQNVVDGGT